MSAGYTLAEALVALVVVGLAVGGLTLATEQILRLQAAAGHDAKAAAGASRLSAAFSGLLDGEGPFPSEDRDGFFGDSDQFDFPCGDRTCGGELVRRSNGIELVLRARSGRSSVFPLGADRALAFEYSSANGEHDAWPPTDARRPEALRSIELMRTRLGAEAPIAQARIWNEQAADCAFDTISRTCRTEPTR